MEKFSLTEDEKLGIALEENDVVSSNEECQRSLFGAIHGIKKANYLGLKSTMTHIWPLQENFVLFLILKDWVEGNVEQDMNFSLVDVWIQIWDLPHNWISTETGLRIGKMFHSMSDIYIPDSGSVKGRHIKILVAINLNKPLLRGASIKLGGVTKWVNFKYEKMVGYCFYCGFVGHLDRMCEKKKKDIKDNTFCDGQYGEWLRAADLQIPMKSKPVLSSPHAVRDEVTVPDQSFSVPPLLNNPQATEKEKIEKEHISSAKENLDVVCNKRRVDLMAILPTVEGKMKTVEEMPESSSKPLNVQDLVSISLKGNPGAEGIVSMDFSNLIDIEVKKNTARTPLREIQNEIIRFVGNGNGKAPVQKAKKIIKGGCQKKRSGNNDKMRFVFEVGAKRRRMLTDENNDPNSEGAKIRKSRMDLLSWCKGSKHNSLKQIGALNAQLDKITSLGSHRDWIEWRRVKRWNEVLVREIFSPFQAERILETQVSFPGQRDKLSWSLTKSGVFTVNSAYHNALLLSNQSGDVAEELFWIVKDYTRDLVQWLPLYICFIVVECHLRDLFLPL
ncbi:hypothetical protein DH2020_037529 [Rehmannia glutinosa]|uniref:Zinc knuckle CX2CX4HX4C domain-containing protein n=1 Tax=Rehmannia glutinosa TaxID=99300 RepID=A0ABR0V1F0_REHGL